LSGICSFLSSVKFYGRSRTTTFRDDKQGFLEKPDCFVVALLLLAMTAKMFPQERDITMNYLKKLKTVLSLTIFLLIVCGLIYPAAMALAGRLFFHRQADGNLIYVNGKAVGSELIGQDFTGPQFMKCRPSAVRYNTYTAEMKESGEYKGVSSGSGNLAPSNPALKARINKDAEKFVSENPSVRKRDIPADMLAQSGSGLDPHISPRAAAAQIPAISKASGISEQELAKIVDKNTERKLLGIFGEERVNVLKVNLDIKKKLTAALH